MRNLGGDQSVFWSAPICTSPPDSLISICRRTRAKINVPHWLADLPLPNPRSSVFIRGQYPFRRSEQPGRWNDEGQSARNRRRDRGRSDRLYGLRLAARPGALWTRSARRIAWDWGWLCQEPFDYRRDWVRYRRA